MRTLVLLTAFALLLAGCSGGSDTGTTSSSTTSTASTTQATSTGATTSATTTSGTTTAPAANRAPTATLTASVPGGTLPLNVTFKLEGADADQDELTFTFDADGKQPAERVGNGSGLPATVVFSYAAAGNYTAVLKVSDGTNETQATAKISVQAGAKPAVVITGKASQYLLCGAPPGDDAAAPIEASLHGAPYTLVPDGVFPWWWIGEADTDPTENGGNSGIVPAGTTSVHICFDEPAPVPVAVGQETDFTLTISPK